MKVTSCQLSMMLVMPVALWILISQFLYCTSQQHCLRTEFLTCNVILLVGITTSWSILTSTFFCLINYPEYQDKIFAELDKNISQDRRPSYKDKANCPILEAVEMEVHRLFTVVPTLISRLCNKDLNLEGYDIPKGTEVNKMYPYLCFK